MIFIPSKGRPQNAPRLRKLFKGLLFSIVVEPQDYSAYAEVCPGAFLAVLPENNRGLAYVRNVILRLALAQGCRDFWMMDDDIKGFTLFGKPAKAKQVLKHAEESFLFVPNLAQGALEYAQFAWKKQVALVSLDGYCDVAVYLRPKIIHAKGIHCREQFSLKVDRDFTMQILAAGYHTARTKNAGFIAPKNGSNAGGLQAEYRAGKEAVAVDRMCKEWGPQICRRIVKKDGRVDLKINFKNCFLF